MVIADAPPFGAWLRMRRKAFDLTQAELASRVSVAPVTIRKLESGERKPSRDLAKLLAAALRVPEREHEAFVRFARSESGTEGFAIPAFDPDVPVWRGHQLPASEPPVPRAEAADVVITYRLFRSTEFTYREVPSGVYLATVEASGPTEGSIEGMLTVSLCHLMDPGLTGALSPSGDVAARFTLRSGERRLEGYYVGVMTPLLDDGGNGEARVQASGRVCLVTPEFVDLLFSYVFVDDVVKMIEYEGAGAIGTMVFRRAV